MQPIRDRLTFFMRHYLVALQSFTRVPVTGSLAQWTDAQPGMLRASAAHFPGVGLLVGFVACLAFAVFSLGLPEGPLSPLAAAVLATVVTVLLTGGVHEGGLAAAADALDDRQERAVDAGIAPRVGSHGVCALVLALTGKCALLGVLAVHSAPGVITALLAGHAVSRFWPLVLAHTMDRAATDAAIASPLADGIDRNTLVWAGIWCLPALVLMVVADGLPFVILALAVSGGALFGLRALLRRKLQGFTQDRLGAAQQACELAFYLGAAFGLGR